MRMIVSLFTATLLLAAAMSAQAEQKIVTLRQSLDSPQADTPPEIATLMTEGWTVQQISATAHPKALYIVVLLNRVNKQDVW